MTHTGKDAITYVVAAIIIGTIVTCFVMLGHGNKFSKMTVSDTVFRSAEDTLANYFAAGSQVPYARADRRTGTDDSMGRLTQRVTISANDRILPISGTVTKIQDAFYPGTYELSFTNDAILTGKVSVQVKIGVKKGESVYILTGDKNVGYSEYTVVEAEEDNCVVFDTNVIRNYTISTTDIRSAQKAIGLVAKY